MHVQSIDKYIIIIEAYIILLQSVLNLGNFKGAIFIYFQIKLNTVQYLPYSPHVKDGPL